MEFRQVWEAGLTSLQSAYRRAGGGRGGSRSPNMRDSSFQFRLIQALGSLESLTSL